MKIEVAGEFHFTIDVPDDAFDIFARAADPEDFPYHNHDGSGLRPGQLVDHLAWNVIANGIQDLSQLDGFGDLDGTIANVDQVTVDRWLASGGPSFSDVAERTDSGNG